MKATEINLFMTSVHRWANGYGELSVVAGYLSCDLAELLCFLVTNECAHRSGKPLLTKLPQDIINILLWYYIGKLYRRLPVEPPISDTLPFDD